MKVYTVNYKQTIYNDANQGCMGVFDSLEKAQKHVAEKIEIGRQEELGDEPWTEEDRIECKEEYESIMGKKLSKWTHYNNFWKAYCVDKDGFGYEYEITELELNQHE